MATKWVAPTPEVQYLPTIFRRIQNGDIRMPAFQRGFVWKPGQVIELLESIYRGFPIGSVLLWKVEEAILQSEDPHKSYLPPDKGSFPTHFILDGLQRLSTLYAVFHFNAKAHPQMFDVSFDLRSAKFVPSSQTLESTGHLMLRSLFTPKEFLRKQQALTSMNDGDVLIDRAVELHSTFQEYMIPTVTIGNRDLSDVVNIFERVNNTGTKFGTVDFMRAVTWSASFDLNSQISAIADEARGRGFDMPSETIVKLFAISLGRVPTPESMLEMRSMAVPELLSGTKKTKEMIKKVIDYLGEYLHLKSYNLVPYEAQFLMLAGFFAASGTPAPSLLDRVTRWFWTVSLNEDMQGRSEYQVAKNVEEMRAVRIGASGRLRVDLRLTPETLLERRFRWGTALSSAYASMLAHLRCRSLYTGEEIPVDEFMASDTGEHFNRLTLGRVGDLPKTIANTFVCGHDDLSVAARRGPATAIKRMFSTLGTGSTKEILRSQLITPQAADALIRGAHREFLERRAAEIQKYAQELAVTE